MNFLVAAQASGGLAALGINWTGLIFQLINFGILFWVLKRYAFPPILRLLERRRAQIAAGLQSAVAAREELTKAEAEREQVLAAARHEATALVEAARSEAQREASRIAADAAASAQATVATAERRITAREQAARAELMGELGSIVAAATASVTREQLTPEADAAVVKRALQEATRS
jgi:F-type H+-transporting ATPase subunit b